MGSYWRDCKYCGQRIIMAEGPYSWQPMEPDGSGRHECGSGVVAERSDYSSSISAGSVPEWDFPTLKTRVTYFTRCWWCREEVFFHRDENGGCVLLDDLGPPWPVHSCWQEYWEQQKQVLSHLRLELTNVGFNGRFYKPTGQRQRFRRGAPTVIAVTGYVADNHVWYNEVPRVHLRSSAGASSAPLVKIEVADSRNRLFVFLVPENTARQIADYEFVTVHGTWIKRKNRWLLLASKIDRYTLTTKELMQVEGITNTTKLLCRYCGTAIEGQSWGLDPDYKIECIVCGRSRRTMSADDYVIHCKKVAKNRKLK